MGQKRVGEGPFSDTNCLARLGRWRNDAKGDHILAENGLVAPSRLRLAAALLGLGHVQKQQSFETSDISARVARGARMILSCMSAFRSRSVHSYASFLAGGTKIV